MASHKEAKAKSETTATPAGRLEQPPAERLAQSIRDLIQEELPEGLRAAVSGPLPSWKDAIWVGVVVADAILLITQVPERIFKNTSFEFASNLVGYVFGGVLLVYSSWAREQIMKFIQIGWCRAALVSLLVLLLFLQAHLFFIHPRIQPTGSKLLVDGDPVHVKYGSDLSLSFGSHDVEVLAPDKTSEQGEAIKQQADVTRPNQFTIGQLDLIKGKFRKKGGDLWTPLYSLSLSRHFSNSIIKLRREGGFFDGIEDSNELSVKLDKDGSMEILEGADSPTVYVPLGQYCIQEVTKDGSRQSEFGYEVVDSANVPDPDDRTKCTAN